MSIIVKIFQGPGNQLFQYAYGLAASKRIGTELKLDLSWFENNADHRSYILDRFGITAEVATIDEINYIRSCNGSNSIQYRFNLLRNSFAPRHRKVIVKEDLSCFDSELKNPYRSSHIEGYFSSELFFEDLKKDVRQELKFKNELPASCSQIIDKMNPENAVALSIRRGDFLKYPLHNICSIQYYQRSVEQIKKTVSEPHLYIFSDEIDWVKQNMQFDVAHTFIENIEDYMEHIRLMGRCKYHIIPNSTFSWWGAWLSDPKVVIAPDLWLSADKEIHIQEFGNWVETAHTVPQSWQRIPCSLEGEELMHE